MGARVVRAGEIEPSGSGTITFEGKPYGSGVSVFLVNNLPGEGPGLHTHPYPETWIVRSGSVMFDVDGEQIEAGPGDIAVVPAETPHGFKNNGTTRLEMTCIHPSPVFIQENLE